VSAELSLELLSGATVAAVLDHLINQHPELEQWRNLTSALALVYNLLSQILTLQKEMKKRPTRQLWLKVLMEF